MVVELGEEPLYKDANFTISANIYSEKVNDYIHHWDGGTFDNYDEAYEVWDRWELSKDEIEDIMKHEREEGDYSHHELEIGILSDNPKEPRELAFMNRTVDGDNER